MATAKWACKPAKSLFRAGMGQDKLALILFNGR